MKVGFSYDRKNWFRLLGTIAVGLILYWEAHISLVVLLLACGVYFLIKNLKIELNENWPWLWTVILVAAGSTFSMFMVQYIILDAELFSKTTNEKLFLNVLCCVVLYLVIQIFTNNTGLSCIVAHLALMCFAFIDYFVYLFRENEFVFSDIRSIGTGISVASNYNLQLHSRGCYAIMASVLYIAFIRKCHVLFQKKMVMKVICVVIIALLASFIYSNTLNVNTETWEQKGSYRNGYLLNFVLGVRDSFVAAPEGYSKEEISSLESVYEEKVTDTSTKQQKKPTIIVVMNESFADLGVLGELKTNKPMMPFFNSLKENTIRGYALSSVFGAKTPNSEWEFLTGNSMAFLPAGAVVYQQYIDDKPASLVSTLKSDGYTCVAMHPYYATGWSRNQVYPDMGFDEMYFLDAFNQKNILRKYVTDEELYNKIIARYETKSMNEDLFMMTISMQNHGGYTEKYENFTESVHKTGISYSDVNQYLSLVNASDQALEKLITYFSQVEDPVEIVFFGDHQPSLNSAFYRMMNGKGLSGLTEDELENLYTVPFFIWTNYPSEEKNIEITSLNFLGTMALEKAGLELPPYNQFLLELMDEVPAINARGYYSKTEQTFLHIEDAPEAEKEWMNKYNILQYNAMFDHKNRSEVFFPYAGKR